MMSRYSTPLKVWQSLQFTSDYPSTNIKINMYVNVNMHEYKYIWRNIWAYIATK